MNNSFHIDVARIGGAGPDDEHAITIRHAQTVFTKLMRPGQAEASDQLRAMPSTLAFWLVDNWWRLRWECQATDPDERGWRLAHDMSAVGAGWRVLWSPADEGHRRGA